MQGGLSVLYYDVIKIGSILYVIIQVNIYFRLGNFKICTILSKLLDGDKNITVPNCATCIAVNL